MKNCDRREFLGLIGMGAIASSLNASIAKALSARANNVTGTIKDVGHIVILMQENNSFDKYFGTLRGVRGFSDPRAVSINLPLQNGTGTTPVSVFLQPAGATNVAAGFAVAPDSNGLGGPAAGSEVLPPFRINPAAIDPSLTSLGLTYLPGSEVSGRRSWSIVHAAWNEGQYDSWATAEGAVSMSYLIREDIPYHFALADAFTVCDAYYCSLMGPTNPNRMYLWSGCVGNVNYLGSGGTDGFGAGPVVVNGGGGPEGRAYYVWQTFPETLQAAGVSWKIYQDLVGTPFYPDYGGGGTSNSFVGNFTDNPVLYFSQYAAANPGTPLFDNACTGTQILNTIPSPGSSDSEWLAWAELLFDQFRSDVSSGTLPQVSWIIAPAGYSEHPSWPANYGAWFISQVLEILVSRPEIWSQTILLVTYDEDDGHFDHVVPPTPPQTSATGASTVDISNEVLSTTSPAGPIGLGPRVPFLAISPWSRGGFVNSQVFDHTSIIQFIEKRFGVVESNISPWRRAVAGDLTSVFDFVNPNGMPASLPATDGYLPPPNELSGESVAAFQPAPANVTFGIPKQETGTRPARALPYELDVHALVDSSSGSVRLELLNTGKAGAVFHVRSANAADAVRNYTVEPSKRLDDAWTFTSSYGLSAYGPNGFARYFNGSGGSCAAVLDVQVSYDTQSGPAIALNITNNGAGNATVTVSDAYTGKRGTRSLQPHQTFSDQWPLQQFHGWYDLIITVTEDPSFHYRLTGHVETAESSVSDPAMGGLLALQAVGIQSGGPQCPVSGGSGGGGSSGGGGAIAPLTLITLLGSLIAKVRAVRRSAPPLDPTDRDNKRLGAIGRGEAICPVPAAVEIRVK